MDYREIDEISDAFLEAWVENFARPMEYVRFSEENKVHPIYNEVSSHKIYDYDEAVKFHGTMKEEFHNEEGNVYGRVPGIVSEITLVTKELTDGGIRQVRNEDIVLVGEQKYEIIGFTTRVQFLDRKIFTKLKVREKDD